MRWTRITAPVAGSLALLRDGRSPFIRRLRRQSGSLRKLTLAEDAPLMGQDVVQPPPFSDSAPKLAALLAGEQARLSPAQGETELRFRHDAMSPGAEFRRTDKLV